MFQDIQEHRNNEVEPWLEGFVQSVGAKEAARLLKGVGELEPKKQVGVVEHVQVQ
jgi:hypothetical protein